MNAKPFPPTMTEKLTEHANKSTPKGVEVAPGINGLVTWAVGRFGAGAIFLVAVIVMYSDLKAERQISMNLLRENITVMQKTATGLEKVNDTMTRMERDRHQ